MVILFFFKDGSSLPSWICLGLIWITHIWSVIAESLFFVNESYPVGRCTRRLVRTARTLVCPWQL